MQKPLRDLFDRWAGQPILVIGGGPSAGTDLPKLAASGIKPACVISANEHGGKQKYFPVDLAVNCDKTHLLRKVSMESVIRELGVPAINRHSWADYRLLDWTFCGNSGLTAIAVACALGGNPVIVTGIDMWQGGRRYFHDKGHKPEKDLKVRAAVTRHDLSRLQPLREFARGANVRPMSGPLTKVFPTFNPAEKLPAAKPVVYREVAKTMQVITMEATHGFLFSSWDPVRVGARIVMTAREIQKLPRIHGRARPLAI